MSYPPLIFLTSEKLHIDPRSLTSDNIEIMLSEINRTEIKIILVNIYSPPKTTTKTLIKVLTNIHHTYLNSVISVIMGDFNIDMNSDSPGESSLLSKWLILDIVSWLLHQHVTQAQS